ncbi:aminotransferase class I/II-fold pyridoxal phosphate-dependent enzyme [Dactylosporangium roseum]|uniref:Aminotransferase class I/II-fold pyridoxal phosphate-dependent enzyme n=2 Tax=Dactylosporangium roseum TaxID=47989 RepID=A0ABY5Z320_9ACTN|nr:aminotransferase class I/II-fold pyridoxal phosphate-dependent enzyme [Dactylosporangium roseum]
MADRVVDFRSDTLTKPSPGMREAMATAEVGDDVFDEDPTLHELQATVAAMFGHEAALFTPSGTMANQLALQLAVPRGDELLCDAAAHVVSDEIGAAAALGGISTRTWPAVGAAVDVAVVESMIRPEGFVAVPTRAVAVEQTHNRGGGGVIPLSTLQDLRSLTDRHGVRLHCDGARIWHAHVADGVPLAEYGALFDTLSVCLSKGLGAPVGSLVVGSAAAIATARRLRKRMGGGMRQAGILAAAGLYALRNNIDRLAEDHARARLLAEAMAPTGVVDPERIRTNILPLDLTKARLDGTRFAAAAREHGILVSVLGPRLVRLVTHLDLTDEGVARAAKILPGLL